VGVTEYLLLVLVIVVPLIIAGAVTLWSLKQVQYRPKKRRPARPETPPAIDNGGPGGGADPTPR
jgi:hypothetical protein